VDVKDLLANIIKAEKDVLYGCSVTVKGWKFSTPGTLLLDEKIYLYRFLDAADGSLTDLVGPHKDGIVDMADTLNDGTGGTVVTRRPFVIDTGSEKPTLTVTDTTHFPDIGTGAEFVFDPQATSSAKVPFTSPVQVKTPTGAVAGTLTLRGEATPKQQININKAQFLSAMKAILADATAVGGDVSPVLFTEAERAIFPDDAAINAFADDLATAVIAKFAGVSAGIELGSDTYSIIINYKSNATVGEYGTSGSPAPADGIDNRTLMAAWYPNRSKYSEAVQNYLISSLIVNQSFSSNVTVYVDNGIERAERGLPLELTRAQMIAEIPTIRWKG
jgi:hypothetical protein